ncbi:unnamed protein product, partial [Symbiodinium pilosum]
EMAKVVSTICDELESCTDGGICGITIHFPEEDGQIPAESEPADMGAVVIEVVWRGRQDLHVAEVRVVNSSLQKCLNISASACNFLAELQERPDALDMRLGSFPDAMPLGAMRRISLQGYHPAAPHQHLQSRNMKDILLRGSFEIAMLRAPEAQLQVVMPKTLIPLAAIKVESADRRQVQTAQDGWCAVALRPGIQKLRLRHELLGAWKEQSVETSSLQPFFQIPMAMELAVWMTPITITGQ